MAPKVGALNAKFAKEELKKFLVWYAEMKSSEVLPHETEWTTMRKSVSSFWRNFKNELCAPEDGSTVEVSFDRVFSALGAVWVHRAKDFMTFAIWEMTNYYTLGLHLKNASEGKNPEWGGNNGPHKHVSRALISIGRRTQADEDALQAMIDAVVKPTIAEALAAIKGGAPILP